MFVLKNMYNFSVVLIDGVLNLTYVENTGGAFGIGSNFILIFIISNSIVIGLLTIIIFLKKQELTMQTLIAISAVIAGGISNLIDRIFRGYVIDYIDINPIIKYPVFNIADICVVMRFYNYCNKVNYKYRQG